MAATTQTSSIEDDLTDISATQTNHERQESNLTKLEQVCDLAQGWHAAARERALSIHLINQYQVGL